MIEALFKLLTPIASLIDQKEKTKYVDEILRIKKEISDEELSEIPDDGRISDLHLQLMRISNVLANNLNSKTFKV